MIFQPCCYLPFEGPVPAPTFAGAGTFYTHFSSAWLPYLRALALALAIPTTYETDGDVSAQEATLLIEALMTPQTFPYRVLWEQTDHSNKTGVGETTLGSYELPANTLNSEGDKLRMEFGLTSTNQAGSVTIRLKIAGNTILTAVYTTSAVQLNRLVVEATRMDDGHLYIVAYLINTSHVGEQFVFSSIVPTYNAANTIEVTGQCSNSATVVSMRQGLIEFLASAADWS